MGTLDNTSTKQLHYQATTCTSEIEVNVLKADKFITAIVEAVANYTGTIQFT